MNLTEACRIVAKASSEISVNTYRLSRETYAEGFLRGFVRCFNKVRFTLDQIKAVIYEMPVGQERTKLMNLVNKLEREMD